VHAFCKSAEPPVARQYPAVHEREPVIVPETAKVGAGLTVYVELERITVIFVPVKMFVPVIVMPTRSAPDAVADTVSVVVPAEIVPVTIGTIAPVIVVDVTVELVLSVHMQGNVLALEQEPEITTEPAVVAPPVTVIPITSVPEATADIVSVVPEIAPVVVAAVKEGATPRPIGQ